MGGIPRLQPRGRTSNEVKQPVETLGKKRQKMGDPTNRYKYKIEWSDEDEEWVGTVLELLNLSWLDKTPDQALNGIQQVARECVSDMLTHGEEPPIPVVEKRQPSL